MDSLVESHTRKREANSLPGRLDVFQKVAFFLQHFQLTSGERPDRLMGVA